ncbi:MAG: lytic transglycosylase domain-containing protein [Patescibacteria group bacterium]
MLTCGLPCWGLAGSIDGSPVCYDKLFRAVCKVESDNNPKAIGDKGRSYGIAQIQKEAVRDANDTLRTRYTHEDCFDPALSRKIFVAYLSRYCTEKRLGREPTMEDASRIWNGGPNGYKKQATIKYWQKLSAYFHKPNAGGQRAGDSRYAEPPCSQSKSGGKRHDGI